MDGFAALEFALDPGLENCLNKRSTSAVNESGLLAEVVARYCALIGLTDEKRLALHRSNQSGDFVLVRYEPAGRKHAPVLRWADDDHLFVDLGEVTWLTPQIQHLGPVSISYAYHGAEPSLD